MTKTIPTFKSSLTPPKFECLVCGTVSEDPRDIVEEWCPKCKLNHRKDVLECYGTVLFTKHVDHDVVARWLRRRSFEGILDPADVASPVSSARSEALYYSRKAGCGVNLEKAPDSVSLMLTRERRIGWHFSLCCVSDSGYRGYQPEEGEHWKEIVFRGMSARLLDTYPMSDLGRVKGVRHWWIKCDVEDPTEPVNAYLKAIDA